MARTPTQQAFIDEAEITVKAGDGGNGIVSFLREKYRPKGGPAGGDGGLGGSVYLKVSTNLVTLQDFQHQRHFKAERGQDGMGKNKSGHAGKDLTIPVPPGTLVFDAETGARLADLHSPGEIFLVAQGGKGGLGNQHFATARYKAPRKQTDGHPGAERSLRLELRLLADVGLVGFPSAGKSTFLNRVSNAKPRIASYPFTTLTPSVGIVKVGDFHMFTMADIPGIIEGAHEGRGLGIQFLRHIARTRILCHLVELKPEHVEDIGPLIEEYHAVLEELGHFPLGDDEEDEGGVTLLDKPRMTVLNKVDLLPDIESAEAIRARFIEAIEEETPVFLASTAHEHGLAALVVALMQAVLAGREDPHAGLKVRYTLPPARLNVQETRRDASRWTEADVSQRLALDLGGAEIGKRDAEQNPEGVIELPDGRLIRMKR